MLVWVIYKDVIRLESLLQTGRNHVLTFSNQNLKFNRNGPLNFNES